ncbi:MAG: hypothetical protein ACJAYS_000709 [Lentimonas sp.]|jgi:hypothetical protein
MGNFSWTFLKRASIKISGEFIYLVKIRVTYLSVSVCRNLLIVKA